jgi:hypothetical protein
MGVPVFSNLTSGHNESATLTSGTTASVSPSANGLLILAVGGFDNTGGQDFTVSSVSGLGLTWTRRKLGIAGTVGGGLKGDVEVWTAPAGASPGSGTITITLTGTVSGGIAWVLDQATDGSNTPTVVTGNIVSGNNNSATTSVIYGTAASSSNLFWYMSVCLLGITNVITQSPAETPAWTELAEVQSSTGSLAGANVETQVSPDTTNLTGSATLSTGHSWGTIGLEIAGGSSNVSVSGNTATVSAAAPSGAESVSVAGAAAQVSASALVGAASVSVAGSTSTVAVAALMGTAATGAGQPPAAVSVTALAGPVSVSTAGPVGQVAVAARLGSARSHNPGAANGTLLLAHIV